MQYGFKEIYVHKAEFCFLKGKIEMKKLLQILFFSSTLALLGGGDPVKFNNYPKDQSAQKGLERAGSNRQKALEIRRRRVEEAAEEERIVREYEAEKAAEERSREAGEEELNKEAAQWEAVYEVEAQAVAEKRALDAAEKRSRDADEQKKDREYADALEAEKLSERERNSREAAEDKARARKRLLSEDGEQALKRPYSQVLQEQLVASEGQRPTWSQALFTGQDDIEKRLIELIGKENKSIKGAIFAFNNETISQAIVDQMSKKNIKVSIFVDRNYFNTKKEKKKNKSCLDRLGDSVHIVRGWHDVDKVMHHKFLLFEDNNGESLLWNGSYNLTGAAQWNNENVIITNDRGLIKSFSDEFNRLMEQNKATTETQISS